KNLPGFIQRLTSSDALLARIDLPLGERLQAPPLAVRISNLSGQSFGAEFVGIAPAVDPQLQGQGIISLVATNGSGLAAGEAVTGHFTLPGEPEKGVLIPREAVVRTQGAGWVYVLSQGGNSFTRIEVPLDHATAD